MNSEDLGEMLEEEMGALEAILMEDVTVIRDDNGCVSSVEVLISPATAQNVSEQHVRCTLVVSFPEGYPKVQPVVVVRNPRGIDETVLANIEQELKNKCKECEGDPVVYELTEVIRESLTENNTPSCPCAICLYHFKDSDHFTKTNCYHYFHKHCLGRYISNCEARYAASLAEQQLAPWQQQDTLVLLCPVCREAMNALQESSDCLLSFPAPEGEDTPPWRPDAPEVIALRERMATLFLKQKNQGGIIDLEQEKNKFLVLQTEGRIEEQTLHTPEETHEEVRLEEHSSHGAPTVTQQILPNCEPPLPPPGGNASGGMRGRGGNRGSKGNRGGGGGGGRGGRRGWGGGGRGNSRGGAKPPPHFNDNFNCEGRSDDCRLSTNSRPSRGGGSSYYYKQGSGGRYGPAPHHRQAGGKRGGGGGNRGGGGGIDDRSTFYNNES